MSRIPKKHVQHRLDQARKKQSGPSTQPGVITHPFVADNMSNLLHQLAIPAAQLARSRVRVLPFEESPREIQEPQQELDLDELSDMVFSDSGPQLGWVRIVDSAFSVSDFTEMSIRNSLHHLRYEFLRSYPETTQSDHHTNDELLAVISDDNNFLLRRREALRQLLLRREERLTHILIQQLNNTADENWRRQLLLATEWLPPVHDCDRDRLREVLLDQCDRIANHKDDLSDGAFSAALRRLSTLLPPANLHLLFRFASEGFSIQRLSLVMQRVWKRCATMTDAEVPEDSAALDRARQLIDRFVNVDTLGSPITVALAIEAILAYVAIGGNDIETIAAAATSAHRPAFVRLLVRQATELGQLLLLTSGAASRSRIGRLQALCTLMRP